MTDDVRLELLLRDTLRASAPAHAPATLRFATLSATSRARQRNRWLAALRVRPWRLEGELAAGLPRVRLVMLIAMLAALVAGAVGAGALAVRQLSRVPRDALPVRPSGSMTTPRFLHASVGLRDGRVLVVGGNPDASNTMIATAEVWDPATGQFTPTASLATPAEQATATLLADGRVLVLGGRSPDILNVTAQVWDPATGRFTSTGSMAEARYGHTATLLPDGRVLVVGGDDGNLGMSPTGSAEVWDPLTGAFSPTGSLAEERRGHTATLLPDGRVLVVGGFGIRQVDGGFASYQVSTAEVWDPADGRFSPAGSLAIGRVFHTATLLRDGTVLVAGGLGTDEDTATAELWNPATATFQPTGPLTQPMRHYTATLLPDGRVLVAGAGPLEVRDPVTGVFSALGSLIAPRTWSTATLLTDGRVLMIGGESVTSADQLEVLASSELIGP